MFAGEKVQVARREDEDVFDASVEPGSRPCYHVEINPSVGEVRERRLDANVAIFVDI